MIKRLKKQSYKYKNLINLAKLASLPLRIIIYLLLFFFLYLILPIYLTRHLETLTLLTVAIFYLVNILIIVYLVKRNFKQRNRLRLETQDLKEDTNLLKEENSRELKTKLALQRKISRYHSLKNIIEDINQELTLGSIAESLVSISFSLIANNKGTGILYLLDKETPGVLSLFKTRKEDKGLIVKAKQGDIFDLWVLRHTSPLFIEDIKKDFRFDLGRLKQETIRPISSLISAPLISENKFLGILRLDSANPGFYAQDDLRFLVTICDLGAVALENGELYQKTQDLAIHDGLTSLYTKGYFFQRLKEECKRSIRQRSKLTLLMLDIDYFKNYNDKFGHSAGDIVLKDLSRNIVKSLEKLNPVVGRFGGEEFCIILTPIDKQKAYKIAEKLRKEIEKMKIVLRRQPTQITVSIGVASYPTDAGDEDELIFKADRAMYEAKEKGRNRVCCI